MRLDDRAIQITVFSELTVSFSELSTSFSELSSFLNRNIAQGNQMIDSHLTSLAIIFNPQQYNKLSLPSLSNHKDLPGETSLRKRGLHPIVANGCQSKSNRNPAAVSQFQQQVLAIYLSCSLPQPHLLSEHKPFLSPPKPFEHIGT